MPKILIIRFSSIGDIVLSTPVIRCLKQQVENIELHYLTKNAFKSILEHNPYIDKIHTYNNNLQELVKKLKEEQFDHIIDLHHNLRTLLIKRRLGIKSYAFNKLNFQKWLMVNLKINVLPKKYIVDRYLDTVKNLDVQNDDKGLDYFIPVKDEIDINTLPALHQNGYIAFVIGAKHTTKKLPADKIIAICKAIHKPVILLGGNDDRQIAADIQRSIGEKIYDACGKYNINQSASLVKQADKVITHDTGLMHIASAFKKEIISIWGNTIPAFGMFPYDTHALDKHHVIETKNLPCRPCSKIGYVKCPKKHFYCMNSIDEEDILVLINNSK